MDAQNTTGAGTTPAPLSVISISLTGELRFLVQGELKPLLELGAASITRASHVLPRNRPLKALFRFLRDRFGEEGRVAQFTRKWPVLWEADLSPSNGPVLGPFRNRQDAINAEIVWLNSNNFGRI